MIATAGNPPSEIALRPWRADRVAGNLCTQKRFSRKVVTSTGANLSGSKIDPFEHFATGCVAVCETAARRSADDGAGRDIRARDG